MALDLLTHSHKTTLKQEGVIGFLVGDLITGKEQNQP